MTAHPQRRAWFVWGAAAVVYIAAVFHRGSLGVAGPLALQRFGLGPTELSVFTVLQVSIYASMQVPTGVLVDRLGSRRMLTMAVLLLGLGQLLFAAATSYPLGLLARAVVGVGDAMSWVSILRLVATHFSPSRYALVATMSSALGAIGGVAATFPLAAALRELGWTTTFLLAGALTIIYASVTTTLVRDAVVAQPAEADSAHELLRRVRIAWAVPGTRLAFWVHFTTMFTAGALALLWGYTYLIDGLGVAPSTAGIVLSVLIIGQVIGGPVVGAVIGRRPDWRMPIMIGYVIAAVSAWTVLLGWVGYPPVAVVVPAFLVFAIGGPVSSVAFALVRDYNPVRQVGTAAGLANTGGHSATAIGVLAVGAVLEGLHGWPLAEAYRLAMLTLVGMLIFGAARTVVWWRRARAAVFEAQARGDDVPVTLRRRSWDLPLEGWASANDRELRTESGSKDP